MVREKKHIKGYWFRLFRWSSSFNPRKDSSVAAVWISLPRLPMNFFSNEMMVGVADRIGGKFLKIDNPTLGLARPSIARICVELDVAKAIPDSIWIWLDKDNGFKQELVFENLPKFCSHCSLQGHNSEECRKGNKNFSSSVITGEGELDKAEANNPNGGAIMGPEGIDKGKKQIQTHSMVGGSKGVDEDGFHQVKNKNGWRKKMKQVSFLGDPSDPGAVKPSPPAITSNNMGEASTGRDQQPAESSIANMEVDDDLAKVPVAVENPQATSVIDVSNMNSLVVVPSLDPKRGKLPLINSRGRDFQGSGLSKVREEKNNGVSFASGAVQDGGKVLGQLSISKQFINNAITHVSGGTSSYNKESNNVVDGGPISVDLPTSIASDIVNEEEEGFITAHATADNKGVQQASVFGVVSKFDNIKVLLPLINNGEEGILDDGLPNGDGPLDKVGDEHRTLVHAEQRSSITAVHRSYNGSKLLYEGEDHSESERSVDEDEIQLIADLALVRYGSDSNTKKPHKKKKKASRSARMVDRSSYWDGAPRTRSRSLSECYDS